jgi:hypothetical protein
MDSTIVRSVVNWLLVKIMDSTIVRSVVNWLLVKNMEDYGQYNSKICS